MQQRIVKSTAETGLNEFDLHSLIYKLAEAAWDCPCIYSGNLCTSCQLRNEESPGQEWDECPKDCYSCSGTSRIVPFETLRVKCSKSYHIDGDKYYYRTTSVMHREQCPGWIPEPDIRVACWEAEEPLIQAGWNITYAQGYGYAVTNVQGHALCMFIKERKEAVIRAALAWLEKQHAVPN